MPEMDGYEVTRRLRANPETAHLPIILFTAKGQVEDKVAGLEVGADEYLTKPTHPAELIARVRNLLKRPSVIAPSQTKASPNQTGLVIGLMAGKGGQGVSTLASNLATGLKQGSEDATVILAELRPGRGDISIQFGYPNPQGLSELLKLKPQDIRPSAVENTLITHKSGIKMLLSSYQPLDVSLFSSAEQMSAIVRAISQLAQFAVLDLGVGLHASTQSALQQCDRLIILAEPDPHTIIHTKSLMDDLDAIGYPKNKILAVMVSRVRTDLALSATDIQRTLGLEITAVFTPAPELAFHAAQMHQSMLAMDPNSFTAQQTAKLVKQLKQPVEI
jgi:Flp pilus assembly CpaE family ATPase